MTAAPAGHCDSDCDSERAGDSVDVSRQRRQYLRTYRQKASALRYAQRYANEHNHLVSIRSSSGRYHAVWDEGELPEPPEEPVTACGPQR